MANYSAGIYITTNEYYQIVKSAKESAIEQYPISQGIMCLFADGSKVYMPTYDRRITVYSAQKQGYFSVARYVLDA